MFCSPQGFRFAGLLSTEDVSKGEVGIPLNELVKKKSTFGLLKASRKLRLLKLFLPKEFEEVNLC